MTEIKFDILKMELTLCQQQMDKYDQLSVTIRTWAITLWAASIGWFIQIKKKEILGLSVFIAIIFWILDAMNKNFREDYKERRDEVAGIMAEFFKTEIISEKVVAPQLPSHRRSMFLKKIFRPHIFPIYLALIIIATIFFFY